ncbi:MAG: SpoIIE family protein phosphatase [Planctomycetia bacterium]|nr:SpoIIE family protein phosphatase [Planctomycetia bacterium]
MVKTKKVGNTVIIYFLILAFTIIGTYTISIYFHQRRFLMDEYGRNAKTAANYIAHSIRDDGLVDLLKKYSETLKTDDKYYEIQNRMTTFKTASSLTYLYVFVIRDGKQCYLFDTTSPDITYKLGDFERMDPKNYQLAIELFKTGNFSDTYTETYEVNHTKYYGNLVSAYAPILDSDGKLIALVGADFRMSELFAKLNHFILMTITQSSILLSLFLLCGFLMIRHRILKPISTLAGTMKNYILSEHKDESIHEHLVEIKSNNEIGQLAEIYNNLVLEIEHFVSELRESSNKRIRSEGDMRAAKAIQQGILPNHFPPTAKQPNVSVAGNVNTAREVGGDLFDAFTPDDDHLVLIVGDVSGKGIPAALFMSITQTLQRNLSHQSLDPGKIASNLNQLLTNQNNTGMFVTWWIGVLNTRTGELSYCNAGHNHPFLKRADGSVLKLEEVHGLPLAIVADNVYESSKINLHHGDLLVLYTDGVSEAFRSESECYTPERLSEFMRITKFESAGDALTKIGKNLDEFVNGWEQSDDITLLIAQYFDLQKDKDDVSLQVTQ